MVAVISLHRLLHVMLNVLVTPLRASPMSLLRVIPWLLELLRSETITKEAVRIGMVVILFFAISANQNKDKLRPCRELILGAEMCRDKLNINCEMRL